MSMVHLQYPIFLIVTPSLEPIMAFNPSARPQQLGRSHIPPLVVLVVAIFVNTASGFIPLPSISVASAMSTDSNTGASCTASSNSKTSTSISSKGDADADTDEPSQGDGEPPLQLPEASGDESIPSIKLGGKRTISTCRMPLQSLTQCVHGMLESIRFEEMGPVIINADGTTRRIDNWDQMSENEQKVAWRRISKRNEERRKALLEKQQQQQQQKAEEMEGGKDD